MTPCTIYFRQWIELARRLSGWEANPFDYAEAAFHG